MTRPNGAGVAPASRQAQTTTSSQPGPNRSVRLSADEADMAGRMNYVYPHDHEKRGQRMSQSDALRYHADYVDRQRAKDAAMGR